MTTHEIAYTGNVISGSLLTQFTHYKGYTLQSLFSKHEDVTENFCVRDSDVWLCGFPKTGTTWCQEMIWCIANDLDYERAKISITERFPFFDFSFLFDNSEECEKASKIHSERTIESIKNETGRRFIKTHLPFHFLPRALREKKTKAKMVYTVRNPKDTCISAYHYGLYALGYDDSFEAFCDDFLNGRFPFAPMWEHVLSYYNIRETYGDQLLIVKYEEMIENLPRVIEKVTKFLEKPPLSPENIIELAEHLSFDKIKANPAVNNKGRIDNKHKAEKVEKTGDFIRCGKADQWKKEMSPDIIKKFDERTLKSFGSTDFTF